MLILRARLELGYILSLLEPVYADGQFHEELLGYSCLTATPNLTLVQRPKVMITIFTSFLFTSP